MWFSFSRRGAFTVVEALIALGLVALITGLTIPVYRTYQIRSDLDNATEQVVQLLRQAQTLAQSGLNDSAFGVLVQEGTLFQGDAYALRDPSMDVVYDIPSTIDASGISEVVFSRLSGVPSAVGVITLTALNGQHRDITVDENGVISVSNILAPPNYIANTGDDEGDESAGEDGAAGYTSSNGGAIAGSGDTGSTGTTSSSGGASSSAASNGGSSSSSAVGNGSSSSAGTSSANSAGSSASSVGSQTSSIASSASSVSSDGTGSDRCNLGFEIDGDEVETLGTNDVTFKVLGSQITYGAGGPAVDVRLAYSMDNGQTWVNLFGGNPVSANQTVTIPNIPAGTPVAIRVNGRYSWLFNKTYDSHNSEGHIAVLRDNDPVPDYQPFGNQQALAGFLRDIIDGSNRINIGARDVVFLAELGTLNSASSDFQDAVVLVSFTQKAHTCVSDNEPKVKISFNRLQNYGQGNAAKYVYVGPQAVAFSEEQWIPLKANGQIIIDAGINELVPGLAIERGAGWIRVLNHGSHTSGTSKEIIDARVLLNKAYITSTVNDGGANQTENPIDGVTNDGTEGDEFVPGPNAKSMEFKTRVTTDDDAVILYWTEGTPSEAHQSSSSSSSVQSSSQASVDQCAVPFTIAADGSITLGGTADVTVTVKGSESTYGYRGPEIQVRSKISTNNGAAYLPLFNYRRIKAGDLSVVRNVAAGSVIKLQFEGRYSWLFRRTVTSGQGDAHVVVLKNGDAAPNVPLINQRTSLKSFLKNLISANGTMILGNREAAYLVELDELNANADYQDAVVVVSIDKPAGTSGCGTPIASSSSSVSSSSSQTSSSSASSSTTDPNGDADGDGIKNSTDVCANTALPESVPTESLHFDRYAMTEKATKKDWNFFRTGPRKKVSEYSLADTRGCSCAQLLDAIEGKGIHRFDEYPTLYRQMKNLFSFYVRSSRQFGCSESLIDMVEEGF